MLPVRSLFAVVVPRHLTLLDYGMIVLYFALTLWIGARCVRRGKRSAGDFFLSGQRMAWWALALSMFASGTSSISFMALPAKTYTSDWLVFGSVPAQSGAALIVGIFFVPLLRRLRLTTVYSYLDQRFDPRVRLLGAGLGVFLKIGARMSVVMLLPALALSTVTGLNVYLSIALIGGVTTFYAMEGGFEAVVWTDVLQAIVTLGSLGVSLVFLIRGVPGGWGGVLQLANASHKFHAVDAGFSFSRATVWVFAGMFLASVFTQLADQPNMQRWFALHDDRETRRTLYLSSVIGFLGAVVFFLIGTTLFAFYRVHADRLASELPSDAIFPYFIANELPAGVVGAIVAGLFASSMGALSSILNATAAVVVTDFQGVIAPHASEVSRVRLAKWTTLICGIGGTGMAAYLAYCSVPSLWDEFLKLVALIGGGFPGVFALGLLTRRANSTGVIVGAVGSVVVTWWIQRYTSLNVFFQGFVAVASCMAIGYVVSCLVGRARSAEALKGLVLWDLFARNGTHGKRFR